MPQTGKDRPNNHEIPELQRCRSCSYEKEEVKLKDIDISKIVSDILPDSSSRATENDDD